MRRRIWWSLIIFDSRIGDMADHKNTTLDPTWDCKVPLNVNDSDLRPEMKEVPVARGHSTDAVFATMRSKIGEFTRHANFHLDFTNPALKSVVRDVQQSLAAEASQLDKLEKDIEDRYIKVCNPQIPLHFLTIWMAREQLAKCRLMEYYSKSGSGADASEHQAGAQMDAAILNAFRMLECDTNLMKSPLTKGYRWMLDFHFQFPAYIHIVQVLRRRPTIPSAEMAWEMMSDNFEARFPDLPTNHSPLFHLLAKTVLPAWDACEAALKSSDEQTTPPRIIVAIRQKLAQLAENAQQGREAGAAVQPLDAPMGLDSLGLPTPVPMDFGRNTLLLDMGFDLGFDMGFGERGGYSGAAETEPGVYPTGLEQDPLDVAVNQMNWDAVNPSLGE